LHPWPAGTAAAYVKFGMHERPTLGVALALMLDPAGRAVTDARIAVGCVGPRPQRFPDVERATRGRTVSEVRADAERLAAAIAERVETADDLHGSADYKRDMTRVFVRRALEIAAARAAGNTPPVRYRHTVVV